MRPKLDGGTHNSGYAKRRLVEILREEQQLAVALAEQRAASRTTQGRYRRVLLVTTRKAA